jgi:hypothetical protein
MEMKTSKKPLLKRHLKRLRPLFGPSPVLSTERHVDYENLYNQYVAHFEPKDVFELMLLIYLINAVWLIKRYMRHQTLGIERWHQQSLDFQAKRKKSQHDKKATLVYRDAEATTSKPADIIQLIMLEDVCDGTVADVDEIVEQRPSELAHNRALELGSAFQEQLDKWINSAIARFYKTLDVLEGYRAGSGDRLGRLTDQIVDAECREVVTQEVAAPRLAAAAQPVT